MLGRAYPQDIPLLILHAAAHCAFLIMVKRLACFLWTQDSHALLAIPFPGSRPIVSQLGDLTYSGPVSAGELHDVNADYVKFLQAACPVLWIGNYGVLDAHATAASCGQFATGLLVQLGSFKLVLLQHKSSAYCHGIADMTMT